MLNNITPFFGSKIDITPNVQITAPIRHFKSNVEKAKDLVVVKLSGSDNGIKMEIKEDIEGSQKKPVEKNITFEKMKELAPSRTELELVDMFKKGVENLTGKNKEK